MVFSTITRECKCINIKKIAITTFLIFFILVPIVLGQIDILVHQLDPTVDAGLASKITLLNSKYSYKVLFSEIITILLLALPQLAYSFYIAFPYFINYYIKEKITNNGIGIMCTPLTIDNLILNITIFSFLQVLFMSTINFLVGILILQLVGFNFLISFKIILLILLIECIIFSLLYITNSLIWITYGKKSVLLIIRALVLIFLGSTIPIFSKINFTSIFLDYKILLILILCSFALILVFRLAIKKFDKEKYILSIIKNQ